MYTGTKFKPQPEITKLSRAVRAIQDIDPEMPIGRLAILLDIYHHEGTPFHEVEDRTGIPRSNVSRHVSRLDTIGYPQNPKGIGLVYTVEDDTNRRQRLIYLTDAGKRLAKRLSEALK